MGILDQLGQMESAGLLGPPHPPMQIGVGPGLSGQIGGGAYPYPLFHGSGQAGLSAINPSARGPMGPGVYATPSRDIAQNMYAGPQGTVYQLNSPPSNIYTGAGHRTDAEWFQFKADKQKLLDAVPEQHKGILGSFLDRMWSNDGYPTFREVSRVAGGDDAAQQIFKKAGFAGVSGLVDGPEVVLFGGQQASPAQSK